MPAYTEVTQPSAPPADVETPPTDKTSQLVKLHELYKAGVLTDAEFTAAKADLYGMQPPQPQNMTNNNSSSNGSNGSSNGSSKNNNNNNNNNPSFLLELVNNHNNKSKKKKKKKNNNNNGGGGGGGVGNFFQIHEQPQSQMMTRSANDPSKVPWRERRTMDIYNGYAQVIDGVLKIDTPLPCIAYVYMAPFPFLCLGCCYFGASKLEFNHKLKQVTVKSWNGGCGGVGGNGHKKCVAGYAQITSFETEETITKKTNDISYGRDTYQYGTKMNVKDHHGKKVEWNLGGMDDHSVALQKVRNLTNVINSYRARPLKNPCRFAHVHLKSCT